MKGFRGSRVLTEAGSWRHGGWGYSASSQRKPFAHSLSLHLPHRSPAPAATRLLSVSGLPLWVFHTRGVALHVVRAWLLCLSTVLCVHPCGSVLVFPPSPKRRNLLLMDRAGLPLRDWWMSFLRLSDGAGFLWDVSFQGAFLGFPFLSAVSAPKCLVP